MSIIVLAATFRQVPKGCRAWTQVERDPDFGIVSDPPAPRVALACDVDARHGSVFRLCDIFGNDQRPPFFRTRGINELLTVECCNFEQARFLSLRHMRQSSAGLDMGIVIPFIRRAVEDASGQVAVHDESAQILFYTGVRIERHDATEPLNERPRQSGSTPAKRKRKA